MVPIPVESGKEWYRDGATRLPRAVNTGCPHCGAVTSFVTNSWQGAQGSTCIHSVPCPSCGQRVVFVMAFPNPPDKEEGSRPESIAIHPDPKPKRQPIPAVEHVPDEIRNHYLEAVAAMNCGIPRSALATARIALEGICFEKIPIDKDSTKEKLESLLSKIPKETIAGPLLKVPDGVRLLGNLGSHFNKKPQIAVGAAEATLEFLEYFLEYLYVLPKRVELVLAEVEKLKSEVST